MGVEPLQVVPFVNLMLHWAVFGISLIAMLFAGIIWLRVRRNKADVTVFSWKLVFFGLIFYSVSEYSDLYTPGLKASLGVHNYFTEGTLLVGVALIFIAIKRLIENSSSTSAPQQNV
jgi:hypothetical protein